MYTEDQTLKQQQREASDRIVKILGETARASDDSRGVRTDFRAELSGNPGMSEPIHIGGHTYAIPGEPVSVTIQIEYLTVEQATAIAELVASWRQS